MRKLLKMHLPPKIIRLGYSTRSTIEEHTDMFNLFFYILCFNNFQPRYKLFFQVVRNLLAKIVLRGEEFFSSEIGWCLGGRPITPTLQNLKAEFVHLAITPMKE